MVLANFTLVLVLKDYMPMKMTSSCTNKLYIPREDYNWNNIVY